MTHTYKICVWVVKHFFLVQDSLIFFVHKTSIFHLLSFLTKFNIFFFKWISIVIVSNLFFNFHWKFLFSIKFNKYGSEPCTFFINAKCQTNEWIQKKITNNSKVKKQKKIETTNWRFLQRNQCYCFCSLILYSLELSPFWFDLNWIFCFFYLAKKNERKRTKQLLMCHESFHVPFLI